MSNTIENKRVFKIKLFEGCPIWGKLVVSKEKKGYLKYYTASGEILIDIDNYNEIVINSIISQASAICEMKYSVLWSY